MNGPDHWFASHFGLKSIAEEVIPAEARIDRAVFWPSFGPYAAITVRDLGEVGEVELVASGLGSTHFLSRNLDPPQRWVEVQILYSDDLAVFRREIEEVRPETLREVKPDDRYHYRDGIGFEGVIRRGEIHQEFAVHDDRDLWSANPAHQRFFLVVWRLAKEVLREDWSQRILDPRHFGDLLASEVPRGPSRRRRS